MSADVQSTNLNTEDLSEIMWIKPEYAKERIKKAGEVLIGKENPSITIDDAFKIVSNWRSSHAFPLNSIQNSLRYRVKKIDKEYLIAQRLKRLSSIENKLRRFGNIKLHNMQDIGGCRIILSTNELVYKFRNDIVENNNSQSFVIRKEDDYINTPKNTGYKGIHLISEYCGKGDFNKLKIEIQIRSKAQHYWATGVEIIGTFTNQQLKAGIGEENWLEFFRLLSSLITNLENNEHLNLDYIHRIKQLDNELKIRDKLIGYSISTNHAEQSEKRQGQFLVKLDVEKRNLSIEYFKKTQLVEATEKYIELEQKYQQENINIVLIEAKSIQDLRKGYPNYFADSKTLLGYINHFVEEANKD